MSFIYLYVTVCNMNTPCCGPGTVSEEIFVRQKQTKPRTVLVVGG